MLVSDFEFELPDDQIAQEPRPRGQSRLLVIRRGDRSWQEHSFSELPTLLDPGDLLVANDTRVFPARLIGRRDPSGEPLNASSSSVRAKRNGSASCIPARSSNQERESCSRIRNARPASGLTEKS